MEIEVTTASLKELVLKELVAEKNPGYRVLFSV
jgi:hypothetical protein